MRIRSEYLTFLSVEGSMRSLRWVGFVFSLLIVGVLGGLIAPLPSDAVNATPPVIKIEVKQGTSSTGQVDLQYRLATHVDSTCPAPTPDGTWGPNYCYKIITPQAFTTPNGYQVQIQDVDAQVGKAQLQISDFKSIPGQSPQDGMKLSGIKIVPVATPTWNADSSVEVKVIITATNKFDAQPNPPATAALARRLPWTINTAGYWEALQSALVNTSPVGDIFELFGEGTFVTAGTLPLANQTSTAGQPKGLWNNSYDSTLDDYNKTADLTVSPNACSSAAGNTSDSKLCFTLAGPGNTRKVTFNGKLIAPYPGSTSSQPQGPAPTPDQRFYCTNNNVTASKTVTDPKGVVQSYTDASCQPTVKYTHRFTLKGPDITALTGSEAGGGLVCNESGTAQQLPQCEGTGNPNKPTAEQLLTNWSQALINATLAGLPGVPEGEECTEAVCNGNLILRVKLTPTEPVDETFPFRADGPQVEDKPITVPAGSTTSSPDNDVTFTELITGAGKSKIVIQPDYANWPQAPDGSFFQVDQIQLTSGNGSTNINQTDPNADVVIVSSGGNKCGVIIRAIKQDPSGNGDTIDIGFHAHNSKNPPVSCQLQ
jgi:hypothetical protein